HHQSIALQLSGTTQLPAFKKATYFWPASANAAMALITKSLFGNASAVSIASIDSLELAFTTKFQSQANAAALQTSVEFGRSVATAVFEWSKTDGGHEAYAHVTDPGYIPPTTPGSWVPTPAAFSQPVHPYWGNKRSFIANSAAISQPAPPIPFSTDPQSPFFQMVNELYTVSKSLTKEDSITTRFWGDLAVNMNVPAHGTNILTQCIVLKNFNLDEAAITYAKHGIALNEAIISVFKTKYKYNQMRPISYIRTVMGHTEWNTTIPTPAHPEYSAAHAVVSSACATVLENIFGKQFKFTDHTYDASYGARSFNSFEDCAKEAAYSRLLAGIHYRPSIEIGLKQGRTVGEMVNKLKFRR
ncbi:MAG: vanadium-dependent haloperoxidase, partial [Chitinophagaceae bacterium]